MTARFAHAIVRFRWVVLAIVGELSVCLCGHIPSLEVRVSHDAILIMTIAMATGEVATPQAQHGLLSPPD